MAKKKTHDEFIKEFGNINPDIIIRGTYTGNKIKIDCECAICGNKWLSTPDNLLRGRRCPVCSKKKLDVSKRKTHEEFVNELLKINSSYFLVERYKDSRTKIECECKRCGNRWRTAPTILLKGCGCPVCGTEKKSNSRRKTQEEFTEELNEKNPNIVVLGKYIDCETKVECECLVCGNKWSTRPSGLLSGNGCPSCAFIKKIKSQTKTQEKFEAELGQINPNISILGDYKNTNTKIECKCLLCENVWEATPSNLLRGRKCPVCSKTDKARKRTKTNEEFVTELRSINPNIELLSNYIKSDKNILCKCVMCGHIWETIPNSLISGRGCPVCASTKKADKLRKTHEEFMAELELINPNVTVLGRYFNSRSSIKCICKICGNNWNPKPVDLLQGYGCPKCCHAGTSYVEQCIGMLLEKALSTDIEYRTKKVIGKELDIYIPKYKIAIEYGAFYWHKNRQQNDIEKAELCKSKNIKLITIYDGFAKYAEDDLINHDVLIYHKQMNELDILELVYSILNKINIKYVFEADEIDNIKIKAYEMSRKKTTTQFCDELARVNPHIKILDDYMSSFEKMRVECTRCGHIWTTIPNSLLQGHGCQKCSQKKGGDSKRKGKIKFEEELNEVSENIISKSDYYNTKTKMEFECLICRGKWEATPDQMLQGSGCPYCNGRKVLSGYNDLLTEYPMIASEWNYDRNEGLLPSEILPKNREKVWWKGKCGHEWKASIYGRTYKKIGCPYCNGHKVLQGFNDLSTSFPFLLEEWDYDKNDVQPTEVSKGSNKRVWWVCKRCGNEWQTKIYHRTSGAGCPKCKRNRVK